MSRTQPFQARAACGRVLTLLLACLLPWITTGCRRPEPDQSTVVVAIENSPNSLDPRVGTDAMAERIGGLIYDPLVRKDAQFKMQPWLASSWEQPDPLTWIFHLRDGVRFQNGQPLEGADVVWTINSLRDGSLMTSKSGAFASVASAEARDRLTVVLHMKSSDASLLFNLSDGLFGVVPRGAGRQLAQQPMGSGPFRFISAEQDKDVLVERNPAYWAGPPKIARVDFRVVPDAVTVALELKKGSIDIASNELTLDMVHALENDPDLKIESSPGSPVMYLNFNVANSPLNDLRVRQAIALAMDRQEIVNALWLGHARLADTLLPQGHWAAAPGDQLTQYPHDPQQATRLLESAGYRPDRDGIRLRLEMKTSTDETTRLLAQILQSQLREAGILLTLRSAEFGTFYSDVTAGRFQMYALRWIGSNQDPDIFRYALGGDRFPPQGGNRGHYQNTQVDALLRAAVNSSDENLRRADYVQVQRILSQQVPVIPLWYPDNQVVHTNRIGGLTPRTDGSFDFLRDAFLQ
jgi:peptide/nickel transport system substrate-binding protein